MSWLAGALAAVGLLVVLPLLVAEGYELVPWLASKIVGRAVRHLPQAERDRYIEEWQSLVNDTPGRLAKLARALGIWVVAPFTGRAIRGLPQGSVQDEGISALAPE